MYVCICIYTCSWSFVRMCWRVVKSALIRAYARMLLAHTHTHTHTHTCIYVIRAYADVFVAAAQDDGFHGSKPTWLPVNTATEQTVRACVRACVRIECFVLCVLSSGGMEVRT